MSDNTHDPPFDQTERPAAPRGYEPEPPIPDEALAVLRVAGHEKYHLIRDRLGKEPLEVIREMKHGGYRFKSKRGYPGVLVMHRGDPVPERMSFRQIAPILAGASGVQVTYETIRRWWEAVFPDEADEPDDADGVDRGAQHILRTESGDREITPRRATRRRTPAVASDGHADTIRAAMAKAVSTNPDVPPAVFLPGIDKQ